MEQSGYNGFNIEEELKKLPAQPGVYIMHDKKDEIIYVGKAISLKNRVRQYFQSSRNKTSKIEQMVSRIARFEYIITDSELEKITTVDKETWKKELSGLKEWYAKFDHMPDELVAALAKLELDLDLD